MWYEFGILICKFIFFLEKSLPQMNFLMKQKLVLKYADLLFQEKKNHNVKLKQFMNRLI